MRGKKVSKQPNDVVYNTSEGANLDLEVPVGLTFYPDSDDDLPVVDFWLDGSRDDIHSDQLNALQKLYTRVTDLTQPPRPSGETLSSSQWVRCYDHNGIKDEAAFSTSKFH